jgi:eukaryotic translation initiation factor 2C
MIAAQKTRQEMINDLDDMIKRLLEAFKARNSVYPERIVCFRDGVSEGQFEQVRNIEVEAIYRAFELLGMMRDRIQVTFVVCQKGHHTRFFYENADGKMLNPCPGLTMDRTTPNSITSATTNEFLLNSHIAIQGTCKPCKYTVVYDDIGLKLSEVELLAYWTTYLYCRCNRTVSYATPAYYAHLASKRGAALFAAGCSGEGLRDISNTFSSPSRKSNTMFFV